MIAHTSIVRIDPRHSSEQLCVVNNHAGLRLWGRLSHVAIQPGSTNNIVGFNPPHGGVSIYVETRKDIAYDSSMLPRCSSIANPNSPDPSEREGPCSVPGNAYALFGNVVAQPVTRRRPPHTP